MTYFLETLKLRNAELYYFGWLCAIAALVFILLAQVTKVEIWGINAWIKPFKFAISTTFYAWAMAWFCAYLPDFNVKTFNWAVIILLGFEIVYIAWKAGLGQLSHYNLSTPFHSFMFSMMAMAATLVTIYTAYIGVLFFINDFPDLPTAYVWGIRLGILIFVIFSFEGFAMGSRLTHTIGGADGSDGIPILNWSKTLGDLRVAHFVGMHALQVLPFLAYYIFKDVKITIFAAVLYGGLAVWTLITALQGKSLFQ